MTDSRPGREAWMAQHYKIGCFSRRCLDCPPSCGLSIEPQLEQEADRDCNDYRLTS